MFCLLLQLSSPTSGATIIVVFLFLSNLDPYFPYFFSHLMLFIFFMFPHQPSCLCSMKYNIYVISKSFLICIFLILSILATHYTRLRYFISIVYILLFLLFDVIHIHMVKSLYRFKYFTYIFVCFYISLFFICNLLYSSQVFQLTFYFFIIRWYPHPYANIGLYIVLKTLIFVWFYISLFFINLLFIV